MVLFPGGALRNEAEVSDARIPFVRRGSPKLHRLGLASMNQYGKFPKLPRMAMAKRKHRTKRIGWLRAAVLGANDGHPFA